MAASPTLLMRREPELGSLVLNAYRINRCAVQEPCSRLSYVEIYNKASSAMRLDGWQLNLKYYDATQNDIAESVLLLNDLVVGAKSYVVLGDALETSFVEEPDVRVNFESVPSNEIRWLTLSYPAQYETILQRDVIEQNVQFTINSAGDGYTKRTTPRSLVGGGLYEYSDATPLRIREIFSNTTACTPDDSATCREYVKLCNMSDEKISLFDYRLAVSASSLKYTAISGELPGVSCVAVYLDIVASGGNAWIEDREGFVSYPETIVSYPNMNAKRFDGHAWAAAELGAPWRWALPTPTSFVNMLVDEPLDPAPLDTRKPCLDGQYRSEETGRCRSLALAGGTLQPCKEGQYRSEETNRCRSLVQAVSSALKPCNDDQFRNPATGRCKKIASSDDLQECAEGYARNPATNRCRKIAVTDMPAADFPVVPTQDVTSSSTTGLIVGLVLGAAAGYAVWEWRREIGAFVKRFVPRKK